MNSFTSRKYRNAAVAGWALAVAITSSAALAQGKSVDSLSTEDIIVEAERAVTATKTDTPLRQIPQSIAVVTEQQIKDQGAETLLKALKYTAGVVNGADDTRGDFNQTRGFWAVNYLDGLKREFGFVFLPRTEIYTLERVDVLLGPSANLYGAGSAGGLVNMQSKRPKFEFGGEATINYGTFDRKQAQFDITGPISDTVAVRLTALVRDADMLLDYQMDNRVIIQPSITWKPTEKTEVTVIGLYQHDKTGPVAYMPLAATLYAPPGLRMDRRTMLGEPDFNHGTKDDKWVTLLVNHEFSDALKFRSASRLERDHTIQGEVNGVYYLGSAPDNPFLDPIIDPTNPSLNAVNSVIPRSRFGLRAHYGTFNSDNNLEFNFDMGPISHKIIAGIDYTHFTFRGSQTYSAVTPLNIYNPVYGTTDAPVFVPQSSQNLTGVGLYIQDQIRMFDRATLVVGARRDRVRNKYTEAPFQAASNLLYKDTTFRAALTVDVTSTLSPYISYSENFQPITGLSQFGTRFDPVTARQYEGGIKWQPVRGAMIRATYYDILEDNRLGQNPNNPLDSLQGGSAKAKGFEFQGNYVSNDLSLSASYTHNSYRVAGEGRQGDAVPKDAFSFSANKTLQLRDDLALRFGGGVRHIGKQISGSAAFFQVVTPSFTLVDAIAAIDYKQWTLQLNATNLLNKYYYAACGQYGDCVNGDPRIINAALTYHF